MKRILCFFGLGLSTVFVSAQSQQIDTVLNIAELEITASRIRDLPFGGQMKQWNSKTLEKLGSNNLAELLNNETGAFIKSYGLGSLATSSIRGGSASHTSVFWNGLPIQSPMLGQLDLALLPVDACELIRFQKGGNSSIWGSGAIGSVITLDNQADFKDRFFLQSRTEGGDFGRFQQQIKLGFGNDRFQSKTKFFHQRAINDFNYLLAPGLPGKKQTNAGLSQQNFLQDIYWKVGDNNSLSFHFWRQNSNREIPPSNVQTRSEAHQHDRATRLMLDWQHIRGKGVWQMKVGIFDEDLDYFDDLTGLEAYNSFRTILSEFTGHWNGRKQNQFYVGGSHTYTKAWSGGYHITPVEHKSALSTSWRWSREDWKMQVGIRKELFNGRFAPFAPVIGIHYKPGSFIQIELKITKDYRLPTINDRYWRPGGNESLLAESGWSEEVTFVTRWGSDNFRFYNTLTLFNRTIENWILWSIPEGQSFWSASNVAKVWSRGLEPRLSFTYQINDLEIEWSSGYDYIRSTNEVALKSPKLEKGEQLIYTPIHNAFGKISVNWKSFHAAYQHLYRGGTAGVNDRLPSYQIGNFRLQYTLLIDDHRGTVFLNLNNIWDENYLVVERRPMPGMNYIAGLNFRFNKYTKL